MKWFFFFLSTIQAIATFNVSILGCGGGVREGNLSAYLIESKGSYICVDAGTLLEGIYHIHKNSDFHYQPLNASLAWEIDLFKHGIAAYLISHAHLDHILGLVINSPEDTPKKIYGSKYTIEFLKNHIFNGKIWPNFSDEGINPIGIYSYYRTPFFEKIQIEHTSMTVEVFPLNHPHPYESSAFLIESEGDYILYFGDTTPDSLQKEKQMEAVWHKVAPLCLNNQLKAIFIECAYDSHHLDEELYGHMSPKHVVDELLFLAKLIKPTDPNSALSNIKVFITHIKSTNNIDQNIEQEIYTQLQSQNFLNINFIIPKQGDHFKL